MVGFRTEWHYNSWNRLTHSSGGNSDAGVSYHFSQTYSPSGRIGDKFCDFTSQNDRFYYDASGYQMHALRKTIDGTSGVPCDFIYDENGNMEGYSVKEGSFVSYNIWNAANQMVATVNTRACGYYGYGMDDSGNQLNVDDYGGGITDTKSNTISIREYCSKYT